MTAAALLGQLRDMGWVLVEKGELDRLGLTNTNLTMQVDGLKQELDARDEHVLDLEAEVREAVPLAVLKDHYLAGIECDHDRKQDRASCSCSLVDLGWQPSVGAAVDSWIAHVKSVEGGGEHGA
jgi:hypothetical protein